MKEGSQDPRGYAVRVLAEALEIEPAAVVDDASIHTLEAWDSLAHLRLVQALEREIGHELPAVEIVDLESLADVERILATAG